MIRKLISLTALISLSPTLAYAEPPAVPAADRQTEIQDQAPDTNAEPDDHNGFMLRMSGGVAALGVGVEPEEGTDFGIGGVGSALNLQLGAAVIPNLAVYADFIAVGAEEAEVGEDDVDGEEGEQYDAEGFGVVGAGVGATYYVMPYDLSLGASILVAKFGAETHEDQTYESDFAVMGKIDVTKEWPVSSTWNLGVGGSAYFGRGWGEDNEDREFDAGIGGLSINMVASYF